MTFGSNLQALRKKVSLSQSQLAAKAGVSVKSLQNWEIDRSRPRMDALVQLAQALGVALEVLMASRAARTPRKKGFFAERLTELRERSGLSPSDLAERSGIGVVTLRQFEDGRREPPYAV